MAILFRHARSLPELGLSARTRNLRLHDDRERMAAAHLRLERDGEPVGFLPAYLKTHSYGEYVFDWSWADAWQRMGLRYTPNW